MDYKNLDEMNQRLKTMPIKGKNYVEVNERIKAFWQLCPNGRIETIIEELGEGICVISASVYEDKNDECPRATGTAYEKEGSTFINKTSYIENCETSAIGRALGNAGIGIDTSVASYEEVKNAIQQQEEWQVTDAPKITSEQVMILIRTQEKYKVSDDEFKEILKKHGYEKVNDVLISDFAKIGNELGKTKE